MKKIEIEHLSFSYDEQIKALDDVSFSIEEGSYTVIVGHNGSGKSTIAKLLIGLLEAQSGTIRVDGIELKEETVYDIRDKVGIVFQNPDNQFIGATAITRKASGEGTKIDTISGATFSSVGVYDCVKAAIKQYELMGGAF